MRPVFSLLVPVLFLFGCRSPQEPLPYPLTITEEGLGAIHPETPFDQAGGKLMGFEARKLSRVTPERPEALWQIRRGENVYALVVSDEGGKKIDHIDVLSPQIKNRRAQGIGDSLSPTPALRCDNGTCSYADEPSLHYRIDPASRIIREITLQKL